MRTTTYLDPNKYFSNPRLDDLLILFPTYNGPDVRTRGCIDECIRLGADICASYGCSDPALHRVLVAGQAMAQIEKDRTRYRYVVWLDSDMTFTAAHLAFLREQALKLDAAVTGTYCQRGNPRRLCLKAIPKEHAIESRRVTFKKTYPDEYNPADEFESYPVTSGMGCLMVPVEQFRKHCTAVPNVQIIKSEGPPVYSPGICCSAMMQDADGNWGWVSEDVHYCEGLWEICNGVWSSPVVFGHVSTLPLFPATNAIWLGETAETATPNASDD